MDSPPTATVTSFHFGVNTDSDLVIMLDGMRLHVNIRERNLEKSQKILSEYLHYLDVAEAFGELDGITVEDFYDWVLEACTPSFSQLERPTLPSAPTLADYLHPEKHYYTLCGDEHDAFKILKTDDNPNPRLASDVRLNKVEKEFSSSWPSFKPSQIMIHADSPAQALSRDPHKVRVEGNKTLLFYKSLAFGDFKSVNCELQAYTKLRQANLPHLRVSRLYGLVFSESDSLLGLLLEYIDCGWCTLHCAAKVETLDSRRHRWAAQITECVTQRHAAGVVWGDVKPANVLIDNNDDAWIVDFGGGYTKGWVDRDLAGTVQGDEQGLRKTIGFIFRREDSEEKNYDTAVMYV